MSDPEAGLGRIVHAALETTGLAALEEMLLAVAAECHGFGAAIWQVRIEDSALSGDSRPAKEADLPYLLEAQTKLFVLAHGFKERSFMCAYHDLPIWRATGQAVLNGKYECPDCSADSLIDHDSQFHQTARPGSLFSVGIRFEDGSLGALTLYRKETGAFTAEDKTRIELFGRRYLPSLYSAIVDRVSYRLVESISALVDRADEEHPGDIMQQIAIKVAKSLACLEVSVFLEDRLTSVGKFTRVASSCKALVFRDSFIAADSGFTPLVARDQKPVLVLDLRHPPTGLRSRAEFGTAENIESHIRNLLGIEPDGQCPPLSFLAVPILVDNRCIGVLRCRVRPHTPYYFSEAEAELLGIVAARIGFFWNRHLRHRENVIVTKSWETFVDELNTMERHLQELSAKSKTAKVIRTFQKEIFEQGVTALEKSIPGADILDVALVNSDRTTIEPIVSRFGANRPSKAMKLPLYPTEDNSWAYVFHNYQSRRDFLIPDTSNPGMPYQPIFPNVKQALFTPIVADNECIGVLSIRSLSFFLDFDKARRMASLVALQVALYHQLTTLLSQQSRAYQDLAHQLRTPVFQARKRLRWILDHSGPNAGYDLQALNGLLAKTQRVLGNMRLYEQMSIERVSASRSENSMDALLKLIGEACADNRVLWRSRKIEFMLDRDSFQKTRLSEIRYDSGLIEQVMNNLLDNAGKYSRKGTEVTISASLGNDRQLEIAVNSRAGLKIDKKDVLRIGERGYRSEHASRITAEGSGIGLYLVKQIMGAHNGELKVAETDEAGFNRVTISIPIQEHSSDAARKPQIIVN